MRKQFTYLITSGLMSFVGLHAQQSPAAQPPANRSAGSPQTLPPMTLEQMQQLLQAIQAQQAQQRPVQPTPSQPPSNNSQQIHTDQQPTQQNKPCSSLPASVNTQGKPTLWGSIRKHVYDKTGVDMNDQVNKDCTPVKQQPGVQAMPQNTAQPVKH